MLEALRTARGVFRSLRIYYGGRHNRAAMDALYARFVKPGDLVFDVGSHVGDRIAAFRRLGARVVACEPNPPLVRTLRLIYGRDSQVMIEPVAVGAAPGTIEMKINVDNPTVSTASRDFVKASEGAPGWQGQVGQGIGCGDDARCADRATACRPSSRSTSRFEAEALAGLTQGLPALVRVHHHPRGVALPRSCAALGYVRYNAALGEARNWRMDDWQGRGIGRWLDLLHRWRRFTAM